MSWLISATAVEDPRACNRWPTTCLEQEKCQINISFWCRSKITYFMLK